MFSATAPFRVLPYMGKYATQHCQAHPAVMSNQGAAVGTHAVLQDSGGNKVVCSLWPKPDLGEDCLQCGCLVSVGAPVMSRPVPSQTPLQLPQTEIQLLTGVREVEDISVTVVVKDWLKARKLVHCHDKESVLSRKVKHILRKLVITGDCFINSSFTRLGSAFGVPFLRVECNLKENFCMCVTADTKIVIKDVVSLDRFRLKFDRAVQSIPKVAGLDHEAEILRDIIVLPQKLKQNSTDIAMTLPRGVLIRGPPGCGKTSLVKSITAELDAFLLTVSGSEIFGSRPGESEENLREAFQKAQTLSEEGLCVLFLDEIDALCPRRGMSGDDGVETRVVSQLLKLLDDISRDSLLVVVGATNRPGVLDPALLTPGRLEKEIFIGMPHISQRGRILETLTQSLPLATDVSLDDLAAATPGYVGADLLSVVQHAQYQATVQEKLSEVHQSHFISALHAIVPSSLRGSDVLVDHRPVLWEEIGGLETVKQQLRQAIEWPLRYPESFQRLGIPLPRGVLLYGPPGCAKTLLVRAAATACHVTFLALSGAQLYSPYVGDSEKKVAEVFQQARAGAPSVLFIDELDSVVGNRSQQGSGKGVSERVLSTLLNEMDGIGVRLVDQARQTDSRQLLREGDSSQAPSSEVHSQPVDNNEVLVVAATNRPDMIDDALLRPGRLDRLIYVPPPDTQARLEILKVHLRHMPTEGIDLDSLAEQTEGFTGADLENLCREAALHALSEDGLDVLRVTAQHFCDTLQKMSPSLTREQLDSYTRLSDKHRH